MTNIAMVKPWPIEIDGLAINSMVIFMVAFLQANQTQHDGSRG
jgi:hypothetical protein